MKKMICVLCVVCICFSMIVTPIAAQVADITAEQASYYPGLTQTTREEADVVRWSSVGNEAYYKISDPTYETDTRTLSSWFPSNYPIQPQSMENIGGEIFSPDAIFDGESRVKETITYKTPNAAIGLIVAEFENDVAMRYETAESTGAMVGDNIMLTCAHCVYGENDDGDFLGWTTRAQVYLARNGVSATTLASSWVYEIFVPIEWIDEGDTKYDWAILLLSDNIGTSSGWFGLRYDNALNNTTATITGYPGHFAEYNNDENGDGIDDLDRLQFTYLDKWYQCTASGTLSGRMTSYLINHTIDATKGQSGSPTYNANCEIIGVFRGEILVDDEPTTNQSVRITNALFDIIEAFR